MSQHDYNLANADGATFRGDINNVLAAILTMNSGSGAPTTTAPFMFWADTANGVMKQRNAADNAWVSVFPLGGQATPTGTQAPYAGRTAPTGWLLEYGQAVSRTTYADLYAVLCPVLGTATITIAAPGVVTLNAHGGSDGDRIRLFTTGALPTGLTANTDYYLVSTSTNTFSLATSQGGAAITTTGTQSGTHTVQAFPYGAGDGSTTFNVPDKRGRGSVGRDNMGGTAAIRVTAAGSGIYGQGLGATGGAETHTLTTAQMPVHNHGVTDPGHSHGYTTLNGTTASVAAGAYVIGSPGGTASTTNAATTGITTQNNGSGSAHNNMHPAQIDNWIIKT